MPMPCSIARPFSSSRQPRHRHSAPGRSHQNARPLCVAGARGGPRTPPVGAGRPGDLMANTPIEFLVEDSDVSLELLYLTLESAWPPRPRARRVAAPSGIRSEPATLAAWQVWSTAGRVASSIRPSASRCSPEMGCARPCAPRWVWRCQPPRAPTAWVTGGGRRPYDYRWAPARR